MIEAGKYVSERLLQAKKMLSKVKEEEAKWIYERIPIQNGYKFRKIAKK